MYFTHKLSTRDMKTPKLFWGYMEGKSLNINRDDILIRIFEYRTVLKTLETKLAEAIRTFTDCSVFSIFNTVQSFIRKSIPNRSERRFLLL
jgi:hypothetical protein